MEINSSRQVIDGNESLSVATNRSGGKLMKVKEHAFTNVGRWWRRAGDVEIRIVHLADSASDIGTIEVGHEIDVMAGQMGVVREMALIEGELEGTVVMMELLGEGGSLDFFLREVSFIAGDTEREHGNARCNRNSGGNGNCGKDFARHEVTWENPSVVGLEGVGAEDDTFWTSDDEGSVLVGVN
jgi:hypothetical protein